MYYFEIIGKNGNLLGVETVPEEDLMEFITTDWLNMSVRYLAFVPGEALVDVE
jgi:hypothetical protein